MAGCGRTVRSNAVPAAGRPRKQPDISTRPELHVVEGTRAGRDAMPGGFARLVTWTRSRSTSLMHIVAAALFLTATLIGALLLRTQMVQNAFEAAAIQSHINTLSQDVEEDQAKLDALISSLPSKAEDMGMVTQQGSVSIDLNGYQDDKGGTQ